MSTISRISIINKDGTCRSTCCHYDGYLEVTGAILQYAYKDEEKINKLMDLGDLSCLGVEQVSSPEMWSNPAKFAGTLFTRAYKDRGEAMPAKNFSSVDDLIKFIDGDGKAEFNYLFADGKWNYWCRSEAADDMRPYNIPASVLADLVSLTEK